MKLITTTAIDTHVDATHDAATEKLRLLELARDQKNVNSADEARYAAEVLRELKKFTTQIESSRKEVTSPVLDLTRHINYVASELSRDIDEQARRISRNLGDWQMAQQKKLREAEQKAREEQARIEQEAREKMERAAATSRTDASFERKADKIEKETHAAVAETRMTATEIASQRPEGIALRKVYKYEVTDIHALYAHSRILVKLEPSPALVVAAIKQLREGETIPGLRHWQEAAVNVR